MTTPQAHVAYVENSLGIHSVYENLTATLTRMSEARRGLTQVQNHLRGLNEKIADREIELRVDAMQSAPERESVAGYDRRVKRIMEDDSTLRGLQREVTQNQGIREGAESEVRQLEFEARAATARLSELGSYLGYLQQYKHLQATALSFGVEPLIP